VQLILFHDGVGMLSVAANPITDDPASWQDFLHYFRFVDGQRTTSLRAERRVGIDPITKQPQWRPFFPEVAGRVTSYAEGVGHLGEIMDALLATASQGADDKWWRDVFVPGQLLPYACLYMDGVVEGEAENTLYRVRNFFHSEQEIHPAEHDLRTTQPAFLEYAANQWFVFSLEGGAFVAFDAPRTDFFRHAMPDHLEKQYLLLFLLALEQRFALMILSDEVARRWRVVNGPTTGRETQLEEMIEEFTAILDKLMSFTAKSYFTQVMQQEHHHRCYQRWQDIFQLSRLYVDVKDEVRDMHNYLDMYQRQRLEELSRAQQEQSEKIERRLNRTTFLIGMPALAFFFLAAVGPQGWWVSIGAGLLALLLGVVLVFLFERTVRVRTGR
jgi:hypothetical protein